MAETVRVAFVLPSYAGGGAERVALTLLGALDRTIFSPSLVVLDGRGPLADRVPDDVSAVVLGRPRASRALPALVRTLHRLRPDVVFSTMVHLNLALLALRPLLPAGCRIVLREANLPSISLANARLGGAMRTAMRRLYPKADAVVATSERMAAEFRDVFGIAEPRLHVAPNPVDAATLRSAASPVRRESGPGPRFVAAGRLTRQKGFDRLPDMMAELNPEARLTVLGEGPQRAALEGRIHALGLGARVTLAGFEPEPWPWIAGADALVMPSRWEGLPNAALEALACGTPVIATAESGGIAEIAAEAPPGAVTVVRAMPDFRAAMGAVVPAPSEAPRPSLLPPAYGLDRAVARFAAILESAVR